MATDVQDKHPPEGAPRYDLTLDAHTIRAKMVDFIALYRNQKALKAEGLLRKEGRFYVVDQSVLDELADSDYSWWKHH